MEEKMVKFILFLFLCFSGFIGLCNAYRYPREHVVKVRVVSNKTIRNSGGNRDISFSLIEDWFPMLEIARGVFISTALIKYRRFPPPEEQVCETTTKSFTSIMAKQFEKFGSTYVHPEFGYLTLANNIALSVITFADTNPWPYDYGKIYRNTKLEIGQELNYFFKTVKVVDFKNCLKAFDPDQRYLLDEKEQFCTTSAKYDPRNLVPDGLIFQKDTIDLVGIESMNNGEFTLSTFVPYHCDGFLKMLADDGEDFCQ